MDNYRGTRNARTFAVSRIITLANMIEVCRVDPSDGRQGQGPADEGRPIRCSSTKGRLTQESCMFPWADAATRCLHAYIQLDYAACVTTGCEALSHQLIPTDGLVTIVALRREGRLEEAEGFGRALLRCGVGPGGMLLLLLMLLSVVFCSRRL